MAGEWIAWGIGLAEKPKIALLAGNYGIDNYSAAARVMCVWEWFDQHTTNGVSSSKIIPILDGRAGFAGWCESMASVHWLRIHPGESVSVVNWDEWNSKSAKRRLLERRRQRRHRQKKTVKSAGQQRDAQRDISVTNVTLRAGLQQQQPENSVSADAGANSALLNSDTGATAVPSAGAVGACSGADAGAGAERNGKLDQGTALAICKVLGFKRLVDLHAMFAGPRPAIAERLATACGCDKSLAGALGRRIALDVDCFGAVLAVVKERAALGDERLARPGAWFRARLREAGLDLRARRRPKGE